MSYIFFRFRQGINWIKVAHVFLPLIICTVSFRSKQELEEENTGILHFRQQCCCLQVRLG